jgi:flagellar M-ring protein FliF
MDQLRRLWESLSLRQKISIGVAAVAVLGGLALFLRYQDRQDFAVLFSGLGPEDGAAVMARLKEKNAEFRLTENGSAVLVRPRLLNELRLELAAAGVPKSGRIGFELFDRNNFGITEFAEQVNYHRALEGEIERTIRSIAEIETGRVHITPPKDSVFEDQRRAAKASVTVKLRPLQKLSANNVKAIAHLVASAVEGLTPEGVSVLDIHGTLLTRPAGAGDPEDVLNQPLLLYKRNMERDLLAKVNATLEPLLGPDRFRAAVSVDCDLSQTEQSEETFDPDASVMTTSQRSEETAQAQTAQGVPGVASNLPRPTSRPGGNGQGLNRRTENLNFQTSRLVKKTRMPQGNIRRVSASVLLDHIVRWEGTGPKARRTVEPPSADRLKATREIVAGAVGFQATRGDLVVVESLPFESTVSWQAPNVALPPSGPAAWLKDSSGGWNVALVGGLGGALVVALIAVVFLLTRHRKTVVVQREAQVDATAAVEGRVEPEGPETGPAGPGAAAIEPSREDRAMAELPAQHDGAGLERQLAAQLAEKLKLDPAQEQALLESLTANVKSPSASSKRTELLARHMSEVGKTNPEGVAQIIRTWINDGEDSRV